MSNTCHLCGGELFSKPVLELKGIPKAAQYYPEKNEFTKDKGINLTIRQCASCGLVQHNLKPVSYFKEVITAASLSEKARQSRLSQMKDFVNKFNLKGRKILDIGTGKGEMLDVLKEAGMKAFGLEASQQSVQEGRRLGRKMVSGFIGQIKKINSGPFDAFICLNYLEHLPEPSLAIKNIYKNTAVESAGFVTVPNFEYLLKTKCFYEFVADHVSYFTKETLAFAFELNGFKVLDCQVINNENDIAVTVKKRAYLNLSNQYGQTKLLIRDLQGIFADYKLKNKKIAVWGAGHRTLALLALAKIKNISYVIDSAKFKQGKLTPITHFKIVPPEYLSKEKSDLVIVMVPGIYPDEVLKRLAEMDVGAKIAILKDNKINFI